MPKLKTLAGFTGYHRERALRFESEAHFHLEKARAEARSFSCGAALASYRAGIDRAGKAEVNAWDSKDFPVIKRIAKTDKKIARVERAIIMNCFVRP